MYPSSADGNATNDGDLFFHVSELLPDVPNPPPIGTQVSYTLRSFAKPQSSNAAIVACSIALLHESDACGTIKDYSVEKGIGMIAVDGKPDVCFAMQDIIAMKTEDLVPGKRVVFQYAETDPDQPPEARRVRLRGEVCKFVPKNAEGKGNYGFLSTRGYGQPTEPRVLSPSVANVLREDDMFFHASQLRPGVPYPPPVGTQLTYSRGRYTKTNAQVAEALAALHPNDVCGIVKHFSMDQGAGVIGVEDKPDVRFVSQDLEVRPEDGLARGARVVFQYAETGPGQPPEACRVRLRGEVCKFVPKNAEGKGNFGFIIVKDEIFDNFAASASMLSASQFDVTQDDIFFHASQLKPGVAYPPPIGTQVTYIRGFTPKAHAPVAEGLAPLLPSDVLGTIKEFNVEQGTGLIAVEDEDDVCFAVQDLVGIKPEDLVRATRVAFQPGTDPAESNRKARRIRLRGEVCKFVPKGGERKGNFGFLKINGASLSNAHPTGEHWSAALGPSTSSNSQNAGAKHILGDRASPHRVPPELYSPDVSFASRTSAHGDGGGTGSRRATPAEAVIQQAPPVLPVTVLDMSSSFQQQQSQQQPVVFVNSGGLQPIPVAPIQPGQTMHPIQAFLQPAQPQFPLGTQFVFQQAQATAVPQPVYFPQYSAPQGVGASMPFYIPTYQAPR